MASFGKIFNFAIIGLFVTYLGQTTLTMYEMFNPKQCNPKVKGSSCLKPYMTGTSSEKIKIEFATSRSTKPSRSSMSDVLSVSLDSILEEYIWNVNVSIPTKTRKNGTLFMHVVIHPSVADPWTSKYSNLQSIQLTKYSLPKQEEINLLSSSNRTQTEPKTEDEVPFSHFQPKLELSILQEAFIFDRKAMIPEVHLFLRLSPDGKYLPVVFVNELIHRSKDLMPINETSEVLPLEIKYKPISIGKLRLLVSIHRSMDMMKTFGFQDKDLEEVMSIFTDTNLYLLLLTLFVSMFHMLFDFLAFKNDISYWKNRENMVGLSTRTVVWRGVSQIIIFLYLWDEDTSLLVLVPAGIGTCIEIWKVKKAFKMSFSFDGWRPHVTFGTASDSEKATEQFDYQAMKYLSYLLYPLCIGGAIYSLLYVTFKSWYSWVIHSLVNGVYAFGFLFMLPQLFVNYKLKSVAHLPWRAFMYKAFNTFIDDMFAFIITMPTAHRLACFRDDIVFVIYLYQRWLYPVDKKRANEFGQTFDEDNKEESTTKSTKKDKSKDASSITDGSTQVRERTSKNKNIAVENESVGNKGDSSPSNKEHAE